MEQEGPELEENSAKNHRKQGEAPAHLSHHASATERGRKLAVDEKFNTLEERVDRKFSHMMLDHVPQANPQRRSKASVTVMEGTNLPNVKCRWTPLPSHIDSSQICQLLCPPPGIRELMLRKGITPRDHCKENRVAIAQKSALNHAARQAARSAEPLPVLKTNKLKPERQSLWKARDNGTDFVLKNKRDAVRVPARCPKKPEPVLEKSKESFGKIPSYLIKRKIELAQEMEKKLTQEKNQLLPPGYVEMDEEEKNEVLTALQNNRSTLEKKLGGLPLVCNTPSQIRAKANIEHELQDIDNAVKRFSRPHVYISLND